MGRRFAQVLALAVVVSTAGVVEAESDFWAEVRRPGSTQYRRALAEGRVLREQQRLREALVALDRAVAALPEEAEGHYWRGNVLLELDRPRDAVEAWAEARERDPTYLERTSHALDMAIALSKLGELDRAVAEYERVIPRLGPSDSAELRATVLSNCAEILMAQGRDHLEDAIRHYRRALEELAGYRLALWGLALALDRQGSAGEARALVRQAVEGDPALSSLRRGGVFFVPAYELHAYVALGQEALGSPVLALEAWQRWRAEGGEAGPWREAAERHAAEVRAHPVVPAAAPRSPRVRGRRPAPPAEARP